MKNILFLFFLMPAFVCLQSQSLIGRVVDGSTKQPLTNVSVYLNGTSIQTMTDEDGMFEISTDKIINTDLIISHVAYNMVSIPNPFASIPDIIYLSKKENVLDEVVVVADKSKRKKMLKLFKEYFLGKTKAGKSCKIANENDIYLYYNEDDNKLIASSDVPLIITNKHLQYEVKFTIVDFFVEFSSSPFDKVKKVRANRASSFIDIISGSGEISTYISGTTSFVDLSPDNKKINKRRNKVYEGSSEAFFKSMVNHTLPELKYSLFYKQFPINPDDYFYVKDTLSMKEVTSLFKQDADNVLKLDDGRVVKGFLTIVHKKKNRSNLMLLTDTFLVDQYGNTNAIDKLLFSGYMAQMRVGDMLPLDYEP